MANFYQSRVWTYEMGQENDFKTSMMKERLAQFGLRAYKVRLGNATHIGFALGPPDGESVCRSFTWAELAEGVERLAPIFQSRFFTRGMEGPEVLRISGATLGSNRSFPATEVKKMEYSRAPNLGSSFLSPIAVENLQGSHGHREYSDESGVPRFGYGRNDGVTRLLRNELPNCTHMKYNDGARTGMGEASNPGENLPLPWGFSSLQHDLDVSRNFRLSICARNAQACMELGDKNESRSDVRAQRHELELGWVGEKGKGSEFRGRENLNSLDFTYHTVVAADPAARLEITDTGKDREGEVIMKTDKLGKRLSEEKRGEETVVASLTGKVRGREIGRDNAGLKDRTKVMRKERRGKRETPRDPGKAHKRKRATGHEKLTTEKTEKTEHRMPSARKELARTHSRRGRSLPKGVAERKIADEGSGMGYKAFDADEVGGVGRKKETREIRREKRSKRDRARQAGEKVMGVRTRRRDKFEKLFATGELGEKGKRELGNRDMSGKGSGGRIGKPLEIVAKSPSSPSFDPSGTFPCQFGDEPKASAALSPELPRIKHSGRQQLTATWVENAFKDGVSGNGQAQEREKGHILSGIKSPWSTINLGSESGHSEAGCSSITKKRPRQREDSGGCGAMSECDNCAPVLSSMPDAPMKAGSGTTGERVLTWKPSPLYGSAPKPTPENSDSSIDSVCTDADDQDYDDEACEREERAVTRYARLFTDDKSWREGFEADGCLTCDVCKSLGGRVKRVPDVRALVSHAKTMKRMKMAEHRGYARAICELMQINLESLDRTGRNGEKHMNKSASDMIVWPPVVVLENARTFKGPDGCWMGVSIDELHEMLEIALGHKGMPSFRAVCGKHGHKGRVLVEFPLSHEAWIDANTLHRQFKMNARGYTEWLAAKPRWHHLPDNLTGLKESTDFVRVDEAGNPKRILYGYLAEPGHMEVFDPMRKYVKDWKVEKRDIKLIAVPSAE